MSKIILSLVLISSLPLWAQKQSSFIKEETNQAQSIIANEPRSGGTNEPNVSSRKRKTLNFFIISKPKSFFDLPSRYNIIRAKIKSTLRSKKFVCIVAPSAPVMASKVQFRLKKYNAHIGNIWFDSHGSYKKGYSFFTVGSDEFSYLNIRDSNQIEAFRELAAYCDSNTRIGIGSCYGGATYARPKSEAYNESRMNGDSLLIGMADLFKTSTVYACESWVMTKPRLFKETFAMAGHPTRKKFKDISFKPVWERLGIWNSYTSSTGILQQVNCIKLDKDGNIGTRFNHYQSQKKVKKQIARNLSQLKEGTLKT